MRTLVAGATGMLGSDLMPALARRGHSAVGLSRAELDITDSGLVEDVIAEIKPDVVFNCAAWTDVDGAETHEREAMRVNDVAAGIVSATAASHGAAVLYVSSDYVFDGTKRSPYVESDLPAAISAYGRSKQAGETSVSIANARHYIVRTSGLFGSNGPNFVETMLRLSDEQPEVLVVSDQVGSPTYTGHLAEALAMLAESEDFGTHHLAAGGRCSWFEFAQEIFDQVGSECRVMAATTDMLGRPAPRPAFSVLASKRRDAITLPDWHQGLNEYLSARQALAGAAKPRA